MNFFKNKKRARQVRKDLERGFFTPYSHEFSGAVDKTCRFRSWDFPYRGRLSRSFNVEAHVHGDPAAPQVTYKIYETCAVRVADAEDLFSAINAHLGKLDKPPLDKDARAEILDNCSGSAPVLKRDLGPFAFKPDDKVHLHGVFEQVAAALKAYEDAAMAQGLNVVKDAGKSHYTAFKVEPGVEVTFFC